MDVGRLEVAVAGTAAGVVAGAGAEPKELLPNRSSSNPREEAAAGAGAGWWAAAAAAVGVVDRGRGGLLAEGGAGAATAAAVTLACRPEGGRPKSSPSCVSARWRDGS